MFVCRARVGGQYLAKLAEKKQTDGFRELGWTLMDVHSQYLFVDTFMQHANLYTQSGTTPFL